MKINPESNLVGSARKAFQALRGKGLLWVSRATGQDMIQLCCFCLIPDPFTHPYIPRKAIKNKHEPCHCPRYTKITLLYMTNSKTRFSAFLSNFQK